MRKAAVIRRAVLAGTVSLAAALAVCGSLAWSRGRHQAVASLNRATAEVSRRAAKSRQQMEMALHQMDASHASPCSREYLQKMLTVASLNDYLKGLGYVENNTLICSTLTEGDVRVALGEPAPVQLSGLRGWYQRSLPGVQEQKFNFVGREGSGSVAIVLPELVLDAPLAAEEIIVVQVSYGGEVIRSQGKYDPRWLQWRPMQDDTLFLHDVLLTADRIPETGQTIYAAMPMSQVEALIRHQLWGMMPIVLAVVVLLMALVYFLARERLSLKSQIQAALDAREFFLVYQPVMDLQKGGCVGAEALIRWKHHDGSMVSPLVFIPAAEKHGLIEQVTVRVMDIVAEDATDFIREHPEAHIAINFSPDDLESPSTGERLQNLIGQIGESKNVVIEATERGLLLPEKVNNTLVTVRSRGVRVGIDDFGTGSSSLSYLATYDLDFLKIDKSFVDALGKDESTSQVAFHIIGLAHSLGLKIVAEGVETEMQRDILKEAGVQFAQGWMFAKPMSIEELANFCRAQNVSLG